MNTTSEGSKLEVAVIEKGNAHARWDLVHSFMKLRKRIFIERMGWSLTPFDMIEFDQYDVVGAASYVIAHDGDEVLGGTRLVQCDTRIGSGKITYSYMIRDAALGLIDLPQNLCWSDPPVDSDSWELTRLVTADRAKSTVVAKALLDTSNDYLATQNATQCLFLGPESFMRMAKMFGYAPEPLGDVVGNEDGKFLVFKCSIQ